MTSPEQYFNLLKAVTELPRNTPEMMERATRYAYHFFFRRQIDFPFVTGFVPGDPLKLKLTFDHLGALSKGSNEYLDRICEGIALGEEFVVD